MKKIKIIKNTTCIICDKLSKSVMCDKCEKKYMMRKIKWAIKVIEKSKMKIGIIDAKAIDIAVEVLRQVRDGELVPKENKLTKAIIECIAGIVVRKGHLLSEKELKILDSLVEE